MRRATDALGSRFWSRLEITPTCWLWKGDTRDGYPRFRDGDKVVSAHHYAYGKIKGPIPPKLVLALTCPHGVRNCVHPDHWTPALRGQRFDPVLGIVGTRADTGGVCRNGHARTSENGHPSGSGGTRGWVCLVCKREWYARRRKARRAETTYEKGLAS